MNPRRDRGKEAAAREKTSNTLPAAGDNWGVEAWREFISGNRIIQDSFFRQHTENLSGITQGFFVGRLNQPIENRNP
jgi:hypothetical protein